MPRESYNTILGVFNSFPVLVLYIELSCKNGIPNVSPMLKERQEGSQEECLRGEEYSSSFLHSQHEKIIMKKYEYSCTLGKREYLLMVHLSNETQLTARKDFCSVVVYIWASGLDKIFTQWRQIDSSVTGFISSWEDGGDWMIHTL